MPDDNEAGERRVASAARGVAYEAFVGVHTTRLRQALVARYGVDAGADAAAAAMAWAWEHWDRLESMANPVGYLFRVGQSSLRPQHAWSRRRAIAFPPERLGPSGASVAAVDLSDVLGKLSEGQRVCVLLVHAHGWPYRDVAEVLGVSIDAVTNHVHRGTKRLRELLKEDR